MKTSALLVLGTAACAWAAGADLQKRQNTWTVGQAVNTSSGVVTGHPGKNASAVSEYLGIPYAAPPVGDLRWAAPLKFNGTAALNGSAFGFSCPVASGGNLAAENLALANITSAGIAVLTILSDDGKQSEDCLTLNVWTKPQTGDAKKAVLVWIYGGGFNSGASDIAGYNGQNIADQEDVIVVSFNYRESILGFPGNPQGPQNLGLLDQRLAIEWVRDNIAAFGGDPTRITLFGQSAGAVSVDYHSYAWSDDPIASGFIPESGTVFSWGLPHTPEDTTANWFNVSATLGCGDAKSDAATVLSCMRTKNFTQVLNAVPVLSGPLSILGAFGPTVDDVVVFSNYSQRTPNKAAMLVGNNNYEAGLFRTTMALANITYPDAFWDDFNLQEFTCPTGIRANASLAAKNPTWRYRYFGVFPNLEVSTEAGAWHAAEVSLLFDTTPIAPAATTEEIAIGSYMRGAWAAFAKDPVNGLANYEGGWPTYTPGGETLIRLAYDNKTGTNAVSPWTYDYYCDMVNVSSTNSSYFPPIPPVPTNFWNVTSTSGSGSGSPSTTGSGSTTSSTAKSSASTLSASGFVVLAAIVAAYMI